jgi:hypothetical protein
MCISKNAATVVAVFALLLVFGGAGALIRLGLSEASAQAPPATANPYYYPPSPRSVPVDFGRNAVVERCDLGECGMPGDLAGGSGGALPVNLDLRQLREENAQLEQSLKQASEEMQALREDIAKLKAQVAKHQDQAEVRKLQAERAKLKQQVGQAQEELKAMRTEVERLQRALDNP